jgi:hypothetical protein
MYHVLLCMYHVRCTHRLCLCNASGDVSNPHRRTPHYTSDESLANLVAANCWPRQAVFLRALLGPTRTRPLISPALCPAMIAPYELREDYGRRTHGLHRRLWASDSATRPGPSSNVPPASASDSMATGRAPGEGDLTSVRPAGFFDF